MVLSWNQISSLVLQTLSPEERQSSVVYLDEKVLPAGSVVEIDRHPMHITEKAVMAFVDLKPVANWAHDCRYVFINPETGGARSFSGQFPPFMRGTPKTLRMIWKGDEVPSWTIATH